MRKKINFLLLLTLLGSSTSLYAVSNIPETEDLEKKLENLKLQTPSKVEAQAKNLVSSNDWSPYSYQLEKVSMQRSIQAELNTQITLTESEIETRKLQEKSRQMREHFEKIEKSREEKEIKMRVDLNNSAQEILKIKDDLSTKQLQYKKLRENSNIRDEKNEANIKALSDQLKKEQKKYETILEELSSSANRSNVSQSAVNTASSPATMQSTSIAPAKKGPPQANFG